MDKPNSLLNSEDVNLYGLAYSCPYLSRIKGCPYKEINSLCFGKKVNWIKGMSNERKKRIIEYHSICSRKRNLNKL